MSHSTALLGLPTGSTRSRSGWGNAVSSCGSRLAICAIASGYEALSTNEPETSNKITRLVVGSFFTLGKAQVCDGGGGGGGSPTCAIAGPLRGGLITHTIAAIAMAAMISTGNG